MCLCLCMCLCLLICVYVDHGVKTMPDLSCLRSSDRFMIATHSGYRKITLVGVTTPEQK